MPAGRLRRAGAGRPDAPGRSAARSGSSTSRPTSRRRSPAACCSATSPSSSTRATPPSPSAGPPRSPSTRGCSPSCSAGPSCASCSTPTCSPRSRPSCSGSTPERRARDAEGVADLLRLLGPLTTDEVAAALRRRRRRPPSGWPRWPTPAAPSRSGSPARSAGPRSRTPAGCATRSASPVPLGVPEAFPEPVADPLADLVARYARTHGPFTAADVAARLGLGAAVARQTLQRLGGAGAGARGRVPARPGPAPSGATPRCCACCAAARWPRCARRSSRSRRPRWAASCPPGSTSTGPARSPARRRRRAAGRRAARRVRRCPPRRWSRSCCPPGCRDYEPALLDELTASGEVIWAGHGALPGNDGWVSLHLADQAPLTLPLPEPGPSRSAARSTRRSSTRSRRAARGSSGSWPRRPAPPTTRPWPTPCGTWSGPAGSPTTPSPRCAPSPVRLAAPTAPAGPRLGARPADRAGRAALRPAPPGDVRPLVAAARASTPTRPAAPTPRPSGCSTGTASSPAARWSSERTAGGFAAVYQVLSAFEESGRCRRGYFVEGLGAAQFGTAGAVDRLRTFAELDRLDRRAGGAKPEAVALAATDPANPYGAALPWPDREAVRRPPARPQGRRARRPGRRRARPLRRARRPHPAHLVATTPTLLGPAAQSLSEAGAPRRAGPADGRAGRRRADPRRRLDAAARGARRGRLRLDAARAAAAWLTVPEGDTVWRAARLLDRALSGHDPRRATDFRVPAFATWDLSGGTRERDRLARQAPAHPDRRRRPRGRCTPTSRWRAAGGCSSPAGAGRGRPTPPGWC